MDHRSRLLARLLNVAPACHWPSLLQGHIVGSICSPGPPGSLPAKLLSSWLSTSACTKMLFFKNLEERKWPYSPFRIMMCDHSTEHMVLFFRLSGTAELWIAMFILPFLYYMNTISCIYHCAPVCLLFSVTALTTSDSVSGPWSFVLSSSILVLLTFSEREFLIPFVSRPKLCLAARGRLESTIRNHELCQLCGLIGVCFIAKMDR